MGPAGIYPNAEVTRKATIQGPRDTFGIYRRDRAPHAVHREPTSTYNTGCHAKITAMAPLSLPLSSLLKHKDCLQKVTFYCNVLQGLQHRACKSRLWKRNFGAVSHGVGQLLSNQPRPKNYAASVSSSSADGQDITEKLWSVYNETKRQTEGMNLQHREHSYIHIFHIQAINPCC